MNFLELLIIIFESLIAWILLLVLILRTPAWTFLRNRTVQEVKRKDGSIHFVGSKYDSGMSTSKYGTYIVDPDGVATERKSGSRILHCEDTIGTNMPIELIKFAKILKDKFGFTNFREAKQAFDLWHRCERCNIEAIAILKEKISEDSDGNEIKTIEFICPKCKKSDNLKKIAPEIEFPPWQSLDYGGSIEKFFISNQNPDRLNVIIKREVKNEMKKEKGFPVKWIALGMMMFLVFFGAAIAYQIIVSASIGAVTAAGPPAPNPVGGLFG